MAGTITAVMYRTFPFVFVRLRSPPPFPFLLYRRNLPFPVVLVAVVQHWQNTLRAPNPCMCVSVAVDFELSVSFNDALRPTRWLGKDGSASGSLQTLQWTQKRTVSALYSLISC